jgi:hypothetical protein
MFKFTESQYILFGNYLTELNKQNWGSWPSSTDWATFPGLPAYSIHQYEQTNGKTFVVVKFDKPVIIDEYRKGAKFKVGGDRNYQPVCERF